LTEERTVADLVELLAGSAGDTPKSVLERDVLAFLRALEDRGLLEVRRP
jgi:hypothetical protein